MILAAATGQDPHHSPFLYRTKERRKENRLLLCQASRFGPLLFPGLMPQLPRSSLRDDGSFSLTQPEVGKGRIRLGSSAQLSRHRIKGRRAYRSRTKRREAIGVGRTGDSPSTPRPHPGQGWLPFPELGGSLVLFGHVLTTLLAQSFLRGTPPAKRFVACRPGLQESPLAPLCLRSRLLFTFSHPSRLPLPAHPEKKIISMEYWGKLWHASSCARSAAVAGGRD